ncbi:MATE family efflux transporter [Parvularcula sp. LCG005]|uniref:MATE family efflux transporter n=1 Tax=Parvularcula sp. LCG005 TaxID=3078805 RepID=UPI002941FDFA|nr:MATE family efflux transporter [Parvularcula sp. LCG005]WOI54833.1 MATE family efflux transporter [Parvularcula sp. LCG005]
MAAMITPLLGVVDMAVLARGATTTDIAGVSLAAAVFAIVYWTLGFLRMSLSGLSAQADGRNDEAGLRAHLIQGALLGFVLGFVLLILRLPISQAAQWIMGGGTDVSPGALGAMRDYIEIRLLAAPLAIAFFAGVGWLTGQGRTGLMMVVVVSVTILNAVLDAWFVLYLDWGVKGIAAGTALAEGLGTVLLGGVILGVLHRRGGIRQHWDLARLRENLRSILALNMDIAIRTFLLAFVFAWFARAGGQFGDITLAANEVLMHIVMTAGLLLDGPAIAAETLVGKALGATNDRRARFHEAVRSTSTLAIGAALCLTIILWLAAQPVIDLVIPPQGDMRDLRAVIGQYYPWAIIGPIVMMVPFQLDGIFIGAMRGNVLRNAMLASVGLFAAALIGVVPILGNHGLWLAFVVFMLSRGVMLLIAWPGFRRLTG